ncbi:MAG: hypothetical protein COY58_04515 [Gammaproteobacteria bacterium CG_4_10_14_0_8_um_filter_38_16]|nr:MAG: hypothetical protein COY58_04515 [Gammaproteobacteria bacterium CG_4_10_14_0_8_um_filter_38_16]PJA03184.1 MAG: hypothetical protein COX72_06500 [Gammaproteobacteria bacterium CG_4_10_14_0_2_um_filter_38_22]PJB11219.1 MAG: hypothetical protein CO120_00920 [Gammaproteobacteria bacterium CG_4_9_14_3_um_filter_38_9]
MSRRSDTPAPFSEDALTSTASADYASDSLDFNAEKSSHVAQLEDEIKKLNLEREKLKSSSEFWWSRILKCEKAIVNKERLKKNPTLPDEASLVQVKIFLEEDKKKFATLEKQMAKIEQELCEKRQALVLAMVQEYENQDCHIFRLNADVAELRKKLTVLKRKESSAQLMRNLGERPVRQKSVPKNLENELRIALMNDIQSKETILEKLIAKRNELGEKIKTLKSATQTTIRAKPMPATPQIAQNSFKLSYDAGCLTKKESAEKKVALGLRTDIEMKAQREVVLAERKKHSETILASWVKEASQTTLSDKKWFLKSLVVESVKYRLRKNLNRASDIGYVQSLLEKIELIMNNNKFKVGNKTLELPEERYGYIATEVQKSWVSPHKSHPAT